MTTTYLDQEAIRALAIRACAVTAWRVVDVQRGADHDSWMVGLEHVRKVFRFVHFAELAASPAIADMIVKLIHDAALEPLPFAEYDHGDAAPVVTIPVRHLLVPGKRGRRARRIPVADFEVGQTFTVTTINRDTGELTLVFGGWPWRSTPLRKGPMIFRVVKP